MNVIVKESPIEGKGVFAARDFKKGEIVMKWNPKKLSKEELDALPEKEKYYVAYYNGEYLLQVFPERYINHSCDPNTTLGDQSDVAIRDIKKGEEVTADYAEDLIPGLEMECNCGSKNCKGLIKYENRNQKS